MATQHEVMTFLQASGLEPAGDKGLQGRFPLPDGRAHMVFCFFANEYLLVSSPFARTSSISADKALEVASFATPISRTDDFYMTSQMMPLADLSKDELADIIVRVVHAGDMLEKQLGIHDEF